MSEYPVVPARPALDRPARMRLAASRIFMVLALLSVIAGISATSVHAATSITFTGTELLGKPTDTSITINIVPDTTITYHYQYGTAPATYTNQTPDYEATGGMPHEVTITGLSPNTQYYYSMQYHVAGETDWVTRPEYSFWTQRARGSSFTFTITSDGHANTSSSSHTATWTNVKNDHPDFDIDLGDTFYPLGWFTALPSTQAQSDSKYLAERGSSYMGGVASSAAIFLAQGNHEDEEGWNLDDTPFSLGIASIQSRKAYFPTPIQDDFYTGDTDLLARLDGATYGDQLREDYYAWEWGDVLFVVIDPFQYTMNKPYQTDASRKEGTDDAKTGDQWSWTLGAQQYNWLKQTLENSTATYKFVFSHQILGGIPRDADGGEAGYVRGGAEAAGYFEWGGKNADGTPGFAAHRDPGQFGTEPVHQLMRQNQVSAYFHGHDHQFVYETRDGIVYQEVPSPTMAGTTDFPSVYTEGDHGDYQTIKKLGNYGHLRLHVTPSGVTVDYVRSTAAVDYSYTILPPGSTYQLFTAVDPAGAGTTSPIAGSHTYAQGSTATVTAAANPGYTFDHWSGECTGSGSCDLTMTADKSVTAHFTQNENTLTVDVTGSGSVTKNPDQATYHYGEKVQLTATADPGWSFSAWSGDLTGTANPGEITITGDSQVTATFTDNPPDTSIGDKPQNPTSSTTASFTFSSTETPATFECKLDQDSSGACSSPQTYGGLADGAHTFQVSARDAAGNIDPTPATYSWTVDTTPPDTTISNPPANPTNSTSATFSFSSTETPGTFLCKLDEGVLAACTSPKSYSGLPAGSHTFQVRATDAAGNTDPTPASYTWTIDTTAPDTSISNPPADPSNSRSASFTLSSTEASSTFECNLDGGSFAACTSPHIYSDLGDGAHTFQVRATDAAGNTDPSPASYAWTIDATGPVLTVTGATAGGDAMPGDVATGFILETANDPALDHLIQFAAGTHTDEPLAGSYFGLYLVASDVSPAELQAYYAARGVPEPYLAYLNDAAAGAKPFVYIKGASVTLVDAAKHDLGPGDTDMTVPDNYPPGAYTVEGNIEDALGNTTPVTLILVVTREAIPPDTAITSDLPADPTNSTAASFSFSSTETGSTFECKLDTDDFTACTSPHELADLGDGAHTFQVRAIDRAGNTDPTPATCTWTIDTTGPVLSVTGATADGFAMAGDLATGYFLDTVADPALDRLIQFAAGTHTDEPLAGSYFGLYLTTFTGTAAELQAYYVARGVPEPYLAYLNDAAAGSKPFVYIKGASVTLVDAAKHDLGPGDTDMTVPDNYPPGTYTVQGTIADALGNTTPVTLILVVRPDTTAPDTTIENPPADPSNSDSASFTLVSSESLSTFECALDSPDFTPCTSPQAYPGLAEGAHTFQVRATDRAGLTDATPATHTWTVDTTPLALTALTMQQSLDKAAWTPVAGDLAAGYTVPLDPDNSWNYLDVASLAATHPLADGYYGFTLDQTDLPAGWLTYWAANGVVEDATGWQGQMWRIINGDAPIFYLRVAGASPYMLVDGLGRDTGQPDDFLRVNGDYPLAAYTYTGRIADVLGNTLPVTARMAFIGPFVPAAPVVTPSISGLDLRLAWPAVTTDAGANFTVVTAYCVFRDTQPYFTPGGSNQVADDPAHAYLHTGAAGTAGSYFYTVQAVNILGPSADSSRVGIFAIELVPGTSP